MFYLWLSSIPTWFTSFRDYLCKRERHMYWPYGATVLLSYTSTFPPCTLLVWGSRTNFDSWQHSNGLTRQSDIQEQCHSNCLYTYNNLINFQLHLILSLYKLPDFFWKRALIWELPLSNGNTTSSFPGPCPPFHNPGNEEAGKCRHVLGVQNGGQYQC